MKIFKLTLIIVFLFCSKVYAGDATYGASVKVDKGSEPAQSIIWNNTPFFGLLEDSSSDFWKLKAIGGNLYIEQGTHDNSAGESTTNITSVPGFTTTASRVTVNNSGNVGIGTTAPEALLEVQGAEAINASIVLDADDGDDATDTWTITSEQDDNSLSFKNGTNERFTIDNDGSVGIGRTDPSGVTDPSGFASSGDPLIIQSQSGLNDTGIFMRSFTDNSVGADFWVETNSFLSGTDSALFLNILEDDADVYFAISMVESSTTNNKFVITNQGKMLFNADQNASVNPYVIGNCGTIGNGLFSDCPAFQFTSDDDTESFLHVYNTNVSNTDEARDAGIVFRGCESLGGGGTCKVVTQGAIVFNYDADPGGPVDQYGSNIIFYNNDDSTASSVQEVMRIDRTGNIGIGISAPTTALDIDGTVTADTISISDSTASFASGVSVSWVYKNDGLAYDPCPGAGIEGASFYNTTNNYMCFCDDTSLGKQMHDPATACF